MSVTQTDLLMFREKKDYSFSFAGKASILAGETIDAGVAAVLDVFVERGPGAVAALTLGGVAFDVATHTVQVQDVTPSAAAIGTDYILKVTATTNEGNLLSVAGALHVRAYA